MIKRILLVIVLLNTISISAQEWFTSFDIAKRLAIVQNKMLFVIWEESLDYPYPLLVSDSSGNSIMINLSKNDRADGLIWEHFIPVMLPESRYEELYEEIKDYGARYVNKFNDDSIKIMDINGYILNTNQSIVNTQNLSLIIKSYSLKTNFLKQFLDNYSKDKNLNNAFNLASRYQDYAILVPENVRNEVLELSNIYFGKARVFLLKDNAEKQEALLQRIDLLSVKSSLILNKPKKAKRLLKRIEENKILENNKLLYNFLKYTTFKLLRDEKNISLWKDKVSQPDLKKSELILNITN